MTLMITKTRGTIPGSMLTDEEVLELRSEARRLNRPRVKHHAARLGVGVNCVEKAILGKTYKHLNDREPPFTSKTDKTELIKEVRRLYLEENKSFKQIRNIVRISAFSVAAYCKDIVRNSQKRITPEFIAQTRELYLSDLTTDQVCAKQHIGRKRLLDLCGDLMAAKVQKKKEKHQRLILTNRLLENHKRHGRQVLTDDQVVEARREARQRGFKDWVKTGAKYGVSYSTISMAILGHTFKHVDDLEPPVAPGELKNKRGLRPKNIKMKNQKKVVFKTLSVEERDKRNAAAKKKRIDDRESLRIFTEQENRRERELAALKAA